ncbi:ABC transporter ATP-binding protein (plasmid) [Rossellomorea sp. FS2]|uniref:ABC transporter ATP-binding protein n=1 Tax=Rossellomorea sp. FS2 TaxID=3391447 RepID=UPI003A4DA9B1
MIELKNVSKSFSIGNEDLNILNDINLRIEEGDFVAIMGSSGSGKSTLMNILGCLDKPSSGEYLLDSKEVLNLAEHEIAFIRNESIGFVFQQFHLLPRLSAIKNVELPLIYSGKKKNVRDERSREVLKKVGLSDRMNHFPNELSGGQKQRVAIARAIVNNPKIILADEPTGSLDSKSSEIIMQQFSLLNQEGKTIVVITHEQEVADYANKVIHVHDGTIINE